MVVPVDNNYYSQDLLIVEKDEDGKHRNKKYHTCSICTSC